MLESRRSFMRTLGGAGLGVLALPGLSSLDSPLNLLSFPGDGTGIVEMTLAELHAMGRKGNPFVAYGADESVAVLLNPQPLLAAPPALHNIHTRLGLPWAFGSRVGYREAAQCKDHFKQREATMRRRFASFTDVERAPVDTDVAYLVGGNIDENNRLVDAAGATQYQGKGAIELVNSDPGVIVAAQPTHSDEGLIPTRREGAQSLTVIDKRDGSAEWIAGSTVYETPTSTIAYAPRARLEGSRLPPRMARGVIRVRSKRYHPEKAFYTELYA